MKTEYVGISEDRLHHIIGVARKCYEISKSMGMPEDFCRRMFMLGWNHDVGYEFSVEKREHPSVSEGMLKLINVTNGSKESSKVLHAVRKHGMSTKTKSLEWRILNEADMTTDSKGNDVDVFGRLKDIAERFGIDSEEYANAYDVSVQIGLISV